jgi:hypothetical protein
MKSKLSQTERKIWFNNNVRQIQTHEFLIV